MPARDGALERAVGARQTGNAKLAALPHDGKRMPQTAPDSQVPVHDLVGVGFGPSNLALAIAVTEHNAKVGPGDAVSARFLESKPCFGWHRGMLIDDATMQVSFMKDLVTMRNPSSEFSFLSYLHSKGRLADFVNHKNLFPLRIEFHDYFEWAAAKMAGMVSYGCEVTEIRPVIVDGEIIHFEITSRTAFPRNGQSTADSSTLDSSTLDSSTLDSSKTDTVTYRARNLVIATGLRPNLPDGVTSTKRIWHNHELMERADSLRDSQASRFVVVGAGQSAAEATAFLHDRFPKAEVSSVFSRYGYSPSDDSPFANRIFDPSAVDDFYAAPEETKQRLLDYHGNTNYSVVDLDLINDLYRRVYREKVLGTRRLRVFNISRLVDVREVESGVHATVESLSTGEKTPLEADVIVYATGYQPLDPSSLLSELEPYCLRDDEGRLRVARDYRLLTSDRLHGGIYLQGGTEHTHGITSSLLSNTAVRSGEILQAIVDSQAVNMPRMRLVSHA